MASAVAKHAYSPPKEGNKGNFLELRAGDLIENVKLLDGGWWYGNITRKVSEGGDSVVKSGYFPSTYVTLNERRPSAKQAGYDGGAMRRSNSKSIVQKMSNGNTEGGGGGSGGGGGGALLSGSLSRRSSINKLRMMAYGTTSDVIESNVIKSSVKVAATVSPPSEKSNSRVLLRKSSTAPIDYVNERVMNDGEVLNYEEPAETTSVTVDDDKTRESGPPGYDGPGLVFKLKDDATNSYFTFTNGVYAWVKDD